MDFPQCLLKTFFLRKMQKKASGLIAAEGFFKSGNARILGLPGQYIL